MNKGGFSWKRLVGISAFKSKVSRTIGIPLTASGRRRKLGASVFNAVAPVVGTLAVAAVAAKKSQQSESQSKPQETSSRKGVHFCLVKGVTHSSADGTSHAAAQQLCSMMTLPGLTQFPAIACKRGVTDRVYPDPSALLWDVVEIIKSDLSQLSSEGVAYIQIDAPRYSYYLDPKWRSWIQTDLETDPDAALVESI